MTAVAATFADEEDPLKPLRENGEIATDHQAIQDEVKSAGIEVQVVDWVYQQVTGNSLVEQLVTPISGDFTKIAANATSWDAVGTSLRSVRANLNHGVGQLRQSWEGTAAGAFEDLMVATWTAALEADAAAASLVGQGFQKVSDTSKQMCAKILQLIKRIVDDLVEVAATGWIPAAGWANAVRKVMSIIKYVDMALQIIDALKQLYDSVGALAKSVQAAGSQLAAIKDVHSVGDAVNYALDLEDTVSDVQSKAQATADAGRAARQSAGGQDSAAGEEPSSTHAGSGTGSQAGPSTGSHSGAHAPPGSGGYHTAMSGHLDE